MLKSVFNWRCLAAFVAIMFLSVVPGRAAEPPFDAAALEFFEREVRPILVARCYECHSGTTDEPKGGLRVDSRQALIAGGDTGPAIEPGDAEKSLLIDAINYGDIYQMPPKTKMSAEEIGVLTRWVKMSAPWPTEEATAVAKSDFDIEARKAEHWCWQPVTRTTPPKVRDDSWPRQDLDRFILARLEHAGLHPAPAADKRTLIRRVYFDLIGLPPSPAEVDAFLADESPQAFERVVDQLLDSPQFGERWARHWLDLVRYAETYGHEFDYPIPNAYRYRDYVIRALNADVPYNQFVMEHLAGDLMPNPRRNPADDTNESIIGTAFWWLGEATHAPVDVRGDEAGRIDNQIDVMSKTFLGLTVACARCHDHKFDAISTKDYYAIAGYLQSSRRNEAWLAPIDRANDLNLRLTEKRSELDRLASRLIPTDAASTAREFADYLLATRDVLIGQISSKSDGENLAEDELSQSIKSVARERGLEQARLSRWVSALEVDDAKRPTHPLFAWKSLGLQAKALDAARLQATRADTAKRIEQDTDRDDRFPLLADFDQHDFSPWLIDGEAFGDSPTVVGEFELRQHGLPIPRLPGLADSGKLSRKHRGALRSPTFTLEHGNIFYRLRGHDVQIRLIVDGYFMDTYNGLLFRGFSFDVNSPDDFTWVRQSGDVERYRGHKAYIEVLDKGDGEVAIDEIRFSDGPEPTVHSNPIAEWVLDATTEANSRSLAEAYGRVWREAMSAWDERTASSSQVELIRWAMSHELFPSDDSIRSQVEKLTAELEELQSQLPPSYSVLAMTDGSAENEHIHIRGNHRLLGDEAPRDMLTALRIRPSTPSEFGSGRLEFARKVVAPENPLTARVAVNRIWHHLFGRGIVASTDNFGVLGEKPTHPELLDDLSTQFVDSGWSQKQLIRAIVLSSTYQMDSKSDPQSEQRDPQNLLLHRMNIRRLEGEAIRDAMLKVSGRLDPKPFGPSVAVHVTPFMQGRGRPGNNGPLDGAGRRSIYTEVRRNFLPPMMLAFDTPIPFNTIGRRNVSNVPAQALIMMNDPFVVEQARLWALRASAEVNRSADARIDRLYLDAFSRLPTDDERARAFAFLRQQSQELGLSDEQVKMDLRVWTDLCHVLFNVKEFIFVH